MQALYDPARHEPLAGRDVERGSCARCDRRDLPRRGGGVRPRAPLAAAPSRRRAGHAGGRHPARASTSAPPACCTRSRASPRRACTCRPSTARRSSPASTRRRRRRRTRRAPARRCSSARAGSCSSRTASRPRRRPRTRSRTRSPRTWSTRRTSCCSARPARCSRRARCTPAPATERFAELWRASARTLLARQERRRPVDAGPLRQTGSAWSARATASPATCSRCAARRSGSTTPAGVEARAVGDGARAGDRRRRSRELAGAAGRLPGRRPAASAVVPRRPGRRHVARRARARRRAARRAAGRRRRARLAGRPAGGEAGPLPRHGRQRLRVPGAVRAHRATSAGSSAPAPSRCTRSSRSRASAQPTAAAITRSSPATSERRCSRRHA